MKCFLRAARRVVMTGVVLVLGGCVSATTVSPPCCYAGDTVSARLLDLQVQLEDGRLLSFAEVFVGFEPHDGVLTRSLPFTDLVPADIIYASVAPLLPLYDANGDGKLEEPEVLVLYIREAALAMQVPVAHLGESPGIWALATSNADEGGLIRWAESRRPQMTPAGRRLFADLERIGADRRSSMGDMGGNGGDALFVR